MFIRHKPNKSGSVSIQIVDKSNGRYKVLKTIGSSSDSFEIELLCQKAQKAITVLKHQNELPFNHFQELQFADSFIKYIHTLT